MEKLQPVLKQIFWILFGLALLLVLIGWWSAKGDLSAQIETRKSAVDKAFTDAQQNVSTVPNSKWSDGAKAKNEVHKKEFGVSARGLRQEQLSARTYPARIRNELNQLKYGSKIEKKTLREQFARLYLGYFYEQIKVIKPFINGEGLVDVSSAQVTQEDPNRWRTVRPTSPEIWHAQEDIWLLRSLLDSIAAVNEGAERIDKSPIRALLMLQLRGGDPDAPVGGSSGGGGFGGGGGEGYESGMMSEMGGGGFGGGSGGGGGASEVWTSFEGSLAGDLLTEEFGSSGLSSGGGAMDSSSMSSGGGMDSYEDEDSDGGSGGGDSGKRYVDDGELYRSRAFQLEVKILQQEIPSLLAELTNSSFPVEIVRVDASFGGASGGAGSQMGGSEGGAYESGDNYESGDGGGMSSAMGGGMGGMGSSMGGGMGGMGGMGGGGSGLGNLSFGGGVTGLGTGATRGGSAAASRVLAKKNAIGARLLAAAMADPNVATVRVAGLMTMYISQEENEAQEGAEAAAETESQEAGGVDLPPNETLMDAVEQDQGTDTGDTVLPEEDSVNGGEPTTPADPTIPADPGEATSTPASAIEEPKPAAPSAGNAPAPNNTPDPSAAVPQNGS